MCMEFCVIITNNENLETTKRAVMILSVILISVVLPVMLDGC